jgi:putative hydrolase of the HAD superfamily
MPERYDAICFDLFGTLVDNFTDEPFHACLTEMANALGIDAGQFIALWTDTSMIETRMAGDASSFADYLSLVSTHINRQFQPEAVNEARRIRMAFTRRSLLPREDAIETLEQLRAAGYRLGLITNCTWEVPEVWAETPFASLFDVLVFSCTAGMTKPDPRIYRLASDQLEIAPARCLFIGDGSNHELAGARRAGMDAMLICAPYEREIVMQRSEPQEWTGPVISQVSEVLDYLMMERVDA